MNGLGKKSVIIVTAGVLSLAGAYSWRRLHSSLPVARGGEGPANAPSSVATEPRVVTAADRGAADEWTVGSRRTYEAEFRSSITTKASAPDGSMRLRGTALLELVAQSVDESRVLLRGTLADLTLLGGSEPSTEKRIEGRFLAEMARPFLMKVRRSGQIESIAFDREVKGLGFNIVRNLISTFGFVEPEGPIPDWREWTTQESDAHGIFKARYRQIEPGIFQKTKFEYTHVEMESRLRLGTKASRTTIVASATIRRDPRGILQSVDSEEHMEVPLGDASFQSDSHFRLRLKQHDTVQVVPLALSTLTETPLYTDRPGTDAVRTDSVAQKRALLAGASLPQLMAELERTPPTPQNENARWKTTRRMTALFDLEPEHLSEMRDKLKSKRDPADADMLLAAVSDTRTAAAQATLAALATDTSADPRLRAAATAHLGLQEHPTEETFSNLKKVAEESTDDQTRKSAALALGSAARQAREGGQTSGASQDAVDYLNGALSGASDKESVRLALESLGNAADPSSLPAIEKYLHDPDPVLRRTAVLSLRLYPGADVDGLIAATLGDTDSSVRSGALMALSRRVLSGPVVAALIVVVKNDEDPGLRLQAVSILGRNAGQVPESIAVLEWAKDNDPNADVRKTALAALQAKTASTSRPR